MATEMVAFQPVVLRAPMRTAIGPPFVRSSVNRFNGAARTLLGAGHEGKSRACSPCGGGGAWQGRASLPLSGVVAGIGRTCPEVPTRYARFRLPSRASWEGSTTIRPRHHPHDAPIGHRDARMT